MMLAKVFFSYFLYLFVSTVLASIAVTFSEPFSIIVMMAFYFLLTILVHLPLRRTQCVIINLTPYLTLGVSFSIFQNIYLLFFFPYLEKTELYIIISANFFIPMFLVFFSLLRFPGLLRIKSGDIFRKVFYLTVILIVYSILISIFFQSNAFQFLASARNVLAPFLFFLLGFSAYKYCKPREFYIFVTASLFIVFGFGIYERFVADQFWIDMNLAGLWEAKGITIEWHGLPGNFYSSELMNGDQMRRMTSTFADPINLGAFFFLAFCASYLLRTKIGMLMSLIGSILVISKAAFIGAIVFLLFFSFFKHSKLVFSLVTSVLVSIVVGFVLYSMLYSTQSMITHVLGFFASLTELPQHPLGRGLGNVGVMASLLGEIDVTEVNESGLGALISQLGIVGLFIYVYFIIILHQCLMRYSSLPIKITCMSLLYAIFINMMFNEVAMSPNSCAGYFIIIGFFCAEVGLRDRKFALINNSVKKD